MFTGIIEELGTVTRVERSADAARLTVRGPIAVAGVKHGDSIAVSGVCLTVVDFDDASFTADLRELQRRGIRSLFVEGGPTLASAFLAAGLVDELLVYVAPTLLGGPRLAVDDLGIATIADARHFEFAAVERLGDDLLVIAHPVSSRAPRDSTTAQERN